MDEQPTADADVIVQPFIARSYAASFILQLTTFDRQHRLCEYSCVALFEPIPIFWGWLELEGFGGNPGEFEPLSTPKLPPPANLTGHGGRFAYEIEPLVSLSCFSLISRKALASGCVTNRRLTPFRLISHL